MRFVGNGRDGGPDGPTGPRRIRGHDWGVVFVDSMGRRGFVRSAVLVGAAATAVTAVPAARAEVGDVPHRDVMLALARLVATTPVPFPSFGEAGPAWRRAVDERLAGVLAALPKGRLRAATKGAARLASAGFGGPDEAKVAMIGAMMAGDDGAARAELRAVTAVAVATVSSHYSPDDDAAAALWLDFARGYHVRSRDAR